MIPVDGRSLFSHSGAYDSAIEWAESLPAWMSRQQAWDICQRPECMLRLIGHSATDADARKVVMCACDFARTALPFTDDPCVLECISTVEKWTRGEATIEEVRVAADACAAYASRAATEVFFADRTGRAVAHEYSGGARAAVYAVSCASQSALAAHNADAAITARHACDCAYAAITAAIFTAKNATIALESRAATCADIVRKHFPCPLRGEA